VRRGEVDAILVSKLDRLGRSMRNLSPLFAELDDLGVTLVSVSEHFDSSSTGRMMRTLMSAWAEMERENISERTRSGTRKRVQMGGWVGGIPPYGYQVDATGPFKVLVPDPAESIMIHTVLKWLLDDGVNVTEICKRLNSQGMLPRKGGLWNTINLRNFLQRNQFDDKWTYGKPSKRTSGTPITITVPAIVDAARMADLRAYLAATSTPHKAGTVHPLSGRLTCACGANMYGLDRGDRENRRYRCINSNRKLGKPYCDQPSVLANQIENAVMAEIISLIGDPTTLLAAAAAVLEPKATRDAAASLDAATQRVDRCREAVARATASAFLNDLDDETLALTVGKLNDRLHAAIGHRDELIAAAAVAVEAEVWLVRVQRLADFAAERLQNPDRQQRAAIFEALDIKVRIQAHQVPERVVLELAGAIPADFPDAGRDWHIACGAHASRRCRQRPALHAPWADHG
jgi:DNA invertase Pin-like site-specific DNA recombinase